MIVARQPLVHRNLGSIRDLQVELKRQGIVGGRRRSAQTVALGQRGAKVLGYRILIAFRAATDATLCGQTAPSYVLPSCSNKLPPVVFKIVSAR